MSICFKLDFSFEICGSSLCFHIFCVSLHAKITKQSYEEILNSLKSEHVKWARDIISLKKVSFKSL